MSEEEAQESFVELCRAEVHNLHGFFEGWLKGVIDNDDDNFSRCEQVLHPGFTLVSTSGGIITLQPLLLSIRGAHGSREGLDLTIKNCQVRGISDDLALVSYEEWHEENEVVKGRIASAALARDDEAPGKVVWLHVHETWLPELAGEPAEQPAEPG